MPKKILLIDDEDLVRESLKKLLRKSGYDVITARNGSEALQNIQEDDFDLIISDIRMPDMDGVEVVKRIRVYLKQKKKSIPEIIITGYASKESLEEAAKLKVADYIYKPFNVKDFLEVVKRNVA